MTLDVHDHDRYAAGRTYVYPVVSRRAGGVSIGINLNPNRACNWRCVYCQVPGLQRGSGPPLDLALLELEFRQQLEDLLEGDFMERLVPADARRWNDVAFSGDGEPTSSPDFEAAVRLVARLLRERASADEVALILITNGSLLHLPPVRAGLAAFAEAGGVVWYKLDSATDVGQASLNDAKTGAERARANLRAAAALTTTWVQTMAVAVDGQPPSRAERDAYLALLADAQRERWGLAGVLLYGLARPSLQPEAPRLTALERAWLEAFADEIRALGLEVRVSP
ncbi:MAG: radical SAM protein [Planctomycetota bacterium]